MTTSGLAIHVCADAETTGRRRRWRPAISAQDTVQRASRICEQLGIVEQSTLAGERATTDALLQALRRAAAVLAEGGLLVVTFSGHTERGDGPIETACWCLVDGTLELSRIAAAIAELPASTRLLVICDSCYAAAIASVLSGAQPALVVAGCADDQTMIERLHSEFMVRLEQLVCSRPRVSLDELRDALTADTPDCERPAVWTNAPGAEFGIDGGATCLAGCTCASQASSTARATHRDLAWPAPDSSLQWRHDPRDGRDRPGG